MGGSTFCKKGAAAPSKIYKEIYVHGNNYTFNSLIGSKSYSVTSPDHVSIFRMSPFTEFSIAHLPFFFLSTCIAFLSSRTLVSFVFLFSFYSKPILNLIFCFIYNKEIVGFILFSSLYYIKTFTLNNFISFLYSIIKYRVIYIY